LLLWFGFGDKVVGVFVVFVHSFNLGCITLIAQI
jgi:hypothetical protein